MTRITLFTLVAASLFLGACASSGSDLRSFHDNRPFLNTKGEKGDNDD